MRVSPVLLQRRPPNALLDFDFRWGREQYWLNRRRYTDFQRVPNALSTGGAGFGQALRSGAWSGNLADGVPLIGDGGLRNAEARTNSIRNPTALGAALPALPTNWGVGAPAGITVTPVGRGVEGGLPYIDFQFSGTNNSGGMLFPNVTFEVTDAVCAPGETWTISCFGKLISGAIPNGCSLLLQQRASGAFVTNAGAAMSFGATLAETRGSAAMSATVNQVRPIASFAWPNLATATFVVRFAAPNLKLGPDINDPPILQTTGLAATRTAYSYRETGRAIAPVHYGVARARLVAPLANHAASFPMLFDLRGGVTPQRLSWFLNRATGNMRTFARGDDNVAVEGTVSAAMAVGQTYTLAWARRGAQAAYSLDGGAVAAFGVGASAVAFSLIGYAGDALTPAANTANAEVEMMLTADGEISNDALQALSARFAA